MRKIARTTLGLAAVKLAQLPRSPSECLWTKSELAKIPIPIRQQFDLQAMLYFEEKQREANEEALKKSKANRAGDSDGVKDFDAFQELLAQARENAGEITEEDYD